MDLAWLGFFDSPIGWLKVMGTQQGISQLDFHQGRRPNSMQALPPIGHKVIQWLQDYFNDATTTLPQLDIMLLSPFTPFQQQVWQALLTIPVGETRTYGELAKPLKTCAQAIGQALKRNPVPIWVPCHRIVAKTGIGGFGGETAGIKLTRKRWLLQHEQASGV